MKIEFLSRLYIRSKRKGSFLGFIVGITCTVVLVCMLFKLMMGDFNSSDLTSVLISLIIVLVARNRRKEIPLYVDTKGEISFCQEKLKITYANVFDEQTKENFVDETSIKYDEIDVIEYGKDLNCFRIVAKCVRKRTYFDTTKEMLIEDGDAVVETFVYVYDEAVADEIRMKLQKVTKSIIQVLECEEEIK